MLFSCKFFWFVVCVSLPGSFANTDRAEWRVPSRYTTPAGGQPLFAARTSGWCGFPPEGTLLACGQFTLSPHRPLGKKDAHTSKPASHLFSSCPARTQCSSMFSINIPYPLVESWMNTWVTAPISFPSCIIGDPDIPCTMPPVSSSSSGSVTLIIISLLFLAVE